MSGGGGLQTKEGGGTDWDWYTNPTGAPTAPGAMPDPAGAPTTYYNSLAPYSGPSYSLTPQSGYTSLAQQLQQAMKLTPTGTATPRTALLPSMFASGWSQLYGGPATPTFGDVWGQPPGMGTAPPPGTPGYVPPNQPPPPGGASGSSSNSQNQNGTIPPTGTPIDPNVRPGTTPGTTPPVTTPGTLPGSIPGGGLLGGKAAGAPAGGAFNYVDQRNAFNESLPFTGPEGMDLGRVLFPNGSPKGNQHGGGSLGPKLAGGPLNYVDRRNAFEANLPFTGPEGMDLGRVLFPNGAPKGGRGRGGR